MAKQSAIAVFDDLLEQEPDRQAIDIFDSLLKAAPSKNIIPPSGDEKDEIENRLISGSAEIEAFSDQLFQDAPTEVSKLRRLNQIRREKRLPPIEELPQPRGAELSDLLDVENIPFAGDVFAGKRLFDVLQSAGRAEKGKATDQDMENLADFQDQLVDELRGRTFGGGVAAGVVDSAKFASELLATFGVGGVVKKGVVETGKAVAKKAVKKGLTKLIKNIIKRSVKQSLLLQNRVFPEVIRELIPQFGVDPKILGKDVRFVIRQPGKSIGDAFLNAELDNFIEILSENTGEVIAVFARPVAKLADKLTRGKLPKIQVKLSEFMRKAGISTGIAGTVGELGEERVGDILREISTRLGGRIGVDLGKPVSQDLKDLSEGKFGKLARKFGTEAAIVGVFQGGAVVGSQVARRLPPRKQKPSLPATKQPSEEEIPPTEKKAPAVRKQPEKPSPELLTAEGVNTFVVDNPESAEKVAALADQKTVSRKQLADASGIAPKELNAEQRKQFVDRVKEATVEPTGKSKSQADPPKTVDQVVDTMFPEAEKLQQSTREAEGGVAAIPKMFRPGMSADRNDDGADYWPSKEVSRRVEKARGIKRDTFTSKLTAFAKESWAKITRPQEFLPKTNEFASANEGFRQLKNVPNYVEDQVIRRVGSVVNAMSKPDLNLFSDKAIIDNQLASVERGEPLRFGFESLEQVEQTKARIDQRVSDAPAVQAALESRAVINRELVEKLVANGVIPETALDNVESYFHQQVLAYVAGEVMFTSKTGIRQPKKSFQKARVKGETLAESFDYNTSFIEAEVRWQVDALTKIKSDQIAKDFFKEVYDQKDALKERAKDENWENLVGGPANVARIEEIRRIFEMVRDKQIELDSDEKAILNDELSRLDPTREFRKRIAIGMNKVRGDVDIENIEFKEITDLASTLVDEGHPDYQRAIGARMVLKAVNERATFIKDSLGSKFLDWTDLIPDGHVIWQPEPGNVFYSAYSIPQKIGELLEKEALDSAELTKDQLRMVLAMGAPRTQWVIPERIGKQLDKLERKLETGLVGRMAKSAMRGWKIYTLLNPKRAIPYTIRNATGDVDPVLGGAPGIAFETARAFKDLRGVYKKEISVPDDVIVNIELGVIGSSMTDVEIPDLKNNDIFRRFYDPKFDPVGAPRRLVELYFKTAKEFNEYRENVLRLAAFRYYKKKLQSKTLTHYGGARKEVVDALAAEQGVDVAAAHLSRNLLGDYGDITVLGEWLRSRLIPFWSWQEINIKRYPRLVINSIQAKKLGAASAGVALGLYRGLMLARLASMYAAYWAYNNLWQPDKESDLDTWDRQNPHIVLCRNPDGSVRIFRNVGAMGDLLEWFGLNSLLGLLPKYLDDQITGADLLQEVIKDPVNKFVQGIGPHFKLPVEVPLGISLFPDIFNPRTQDRGEAIASALALRDEYRAARGKILKDGSRARPHYQQRLFVGVVDPKLTALNKIHELRGDFLRKKGKDVPTILSVSKFRNMKLAAVYENFDAFLEARKKYMDGGRGFDNFMDSLNKLDPISARLNDAFEEEFEQDFLNGTQKLDLKVARDYARTLEVYLWNWWQEASKVQDTPEQQEQLRREIKKFKINLRKRGGSRRTVRQRGEPVTKFQQRRKSKIKSANEARAKIKRLSKP